MGQAGAPARLHVTVPGSLSAPCLLGPATVAMSPCPAVPCATHVLSTFCSFHRLPFGHKVYVSFREPHLGSVVGLLLTHASPALRKLGVDLLIDFIKCQVGAGTQCNISSSAKGVALRCLPLPWV